MMIMMNTYPDCSVITTTAHQLWSTSCNTNRIDKRYVTLKSLDSLTGMQVPHSNCFVC
jgi:hypothetical protein